MHEAEWNDTSGIQNWAAKVFDLIEKVSQGRISTQDHSTLCNLSYKLSYHPWVQFPLPRVHEGPKGIPITVMYTPLHLKILVAQYLNLGLLDPNLGYKYFLRFQLYWMLDIAPSCNPVQYQGQLMMQPWKNGQNLTLDPPKIFSWVLRLLVRNCSKLSSYAI